MTLPVSTVKPKLLVVDDEPQIREILRDLLAEKFEIMEGADGLEAVRLAQELRPDVILMDVMMPGLDGISAVKRLRENDETRPIPVLMLTAANSTRQRIRAFDLGADDYISKPFEVDEVIARIQSKLNRVKDFRAKTGGRIEIGNLVLDSRSQEVRINQELVELGPVEYGMMELFLENEGGVVSRKMIMETVWADGSKNDRLIDAHLTSLRKKISKFSGSIQTVYGEGYRLKADNPGQK